MAQNLRAKIPKGDTMTVFDVNSASLEKFAKEAQPASVQIAKTPREVAEKSVSARMALSLSLDDESYRSIYDLSWGLPPGGLYSDFTFL